MVFLLTFSLNISFSAEIFDLTNSLPPDLVKDGSIDYTAYLQKGLNEHRNVLMPDFPILISDKGLLIKSNSTVAFQEKSYLRLRASSKGSYAMLNLSDAENVIIKNPVLVGDRDSHVGTRGEWGMGIMMQGSKNVRIISAVITKCWGDGIYVGGAASKINENIYIESARIDSCRRNGISLVHGNNIEVLNAAISHIDGTPPMGGIDVEPNNDTETIDNIKIINLRTHQNHFGIAISLSQLPGKETKLVRILIDNHIDTDSDIAFVLGSFRGKYEGKKALSGFIEVNNPQWINNNRTLIAGIYDLAPMTKFKNVRIYKNNLQSNEELSKLKQVMMKSYKNIIIE